MANENSKTPTQAQPQMIPLSKIHDLPNVFNPKPQDKTLGSMVLSIESSGVKEAVILRQRSDGEYELLSGYRRRRASELAKKQDIPAHVYEMTMQEAIAYRKAVKQNPNAPILGKLVVPNADKTRLSLSPARSPRRTRPPPPPATSPRRTRPLPPPATSPRRTRPLPPPARNPRRIRPLPPPMRSPRRTRPPLSPATRPRVTRPPPPPAIRLRVTRPLPPPARSPRRTRPLPPLAIRTSRTQPPPLTSIRPRLPSWRPRLRLANAFP